MLITENDRVSSQKTEVLLYFTVNIPRSLPTWQFWVFPGEQPKTSLKLIFRDLERLFSQISKKIRRLEIHAGSGL